MRKSTFTDPDLQPVGGPAQIPIPPDWRRVRIHQTETARRTDPLKSEFWRRAGWTDPLPRKIPYKAHDGNQRLLQRLERVASRPRASSKRTAPARKGRSITFDAAVRTYLPDQQETVANTLVRLEKALGNRQRNPEGHSWWIMLKRYATKFPARARVRDLDAGVLNMALQHLVAGKI